MTIKESDWHPVSVSDWHPPTLRRHRVLLTTYVWPHTCKLQGDGCVETAGWLLKSVLGPNTMRASLSLCVFEACGSASWLQSVSGVTQKGMYFYSSLLCSVLPVFSLSICDWGGGNVFLWTPQAGVLDLRTPGSCVHMKHVVKQNKPLCAVVVTWLLSKQNQIPSGGIGGSLDLSRADWLSVCHKSTLPSPPVWCKQAGHPAQTELLIQPKQLWRGGNNCAQPSRRFV